MNGKKISWEFQFRMFAKGKGLRGHLDSSIPRLQDDIDKVKIAHWDSNDAKNNLLDLEFYRCSHCPQFVIFSLCQDKCSLQVLAQIQWKQGLKYTNFGLTNGRNGTLNKLF